MSRAILERDINNSGRVPFHVSIPTVCLWEALTVFIWEHFTVLPFYFMLFFFY